MGNGEKGVVWYADAEIYCSGNGKGLKCDVVLQPKDLVMSDMMIGTGSLSLLHCTRDCIEVC